MTDLIQIAPRIGGLGCGVDDYAALLAAKLEDDYGLLTRFLVLECNLMPGNDNRNVQQIERRAEALAAALEGHLQVLLHYVGYGFHKRGCPVWLLRGLRKWKSRRSNTRLVTMFHELFATGKPWESSFWSSPLQRLICSELASLSDVVVTNTEASAAILSEMTRRQDVKCMPVFSNVGEPKMVPDFSDRKRWLVLFGGASLRRKALTQDRKVLEFLCGGSLGIERIVEIGIGTHGVSSDGLPINQLGRLAPHDVSRVLLDCRYGFLSYPQEFLEKSGIFAAYAAHGVVPVLPDATAYPSRCGVTSGEHFINASAVTGDGVEVSRNVRVWYQQHRVSDHARVFATSLQISKIKDV